MTDSYALPAPENVLTSSQKSLHIPGLGEPSLIFLFSFVFFLLTLHPALPWGDGPELITASVTLGVPHPPGYPLYVLLGHLTALVPLGNAAVRLHLFSSVCGSCCLVLLWCSLSVFAKTSDLPGRCARLAGVLLLATTAVFWSVARAAEVYTLFALLLAACICLIARSWAGRLVPAPIAGLVVGLGLVHHYAILPVALWVVSRYRRRGIAVLFLPLALVFVPMARSRAEPVLDWYHPGSAKQLAQLLLGGEFMQNLARGWERFSDAPLAALARDVFDLLGQWGVFFPFVLVGFWRLVIWSHRRSVEYALLLVVYAGFYVFYLVGDREFFSLPFLVVSAPLLCLGLEWAAGQLVPRMHAHGPLLLSLLLLLFPCWRVYRAAASRADDEKAFRYSVDVLRVLPANAVLLAGLNEMAQDNEVFPLMYQQVVERRRPDVDVVGTGFLALQWYREELGRRGLRICPRELPLGKYATDREWYEDVWAGIVMPLKERRPICSTVSPAYVAQRRGARSWESCESRLLLQAGLGSSPYLPWGTVFLLQVEDDG